MLDPHEIRRQFPILSGNQPVIHLDSAAATLKPLPVIEAVRDCLERCPAGVHRGSHFLSRQATRLFEEAREAVRRLINAPDASQVIFTPNTTASIATVAASLKKLSPDPRRRKILIPLSEHHSNILPWRALEREGFVTAFIGLTPGGRIDVEDFAANIDSGTALVAAAAVTNVLGIVNPFPLLCQEAHRHGALFLLDAAQAAGRMPIDVQEADVDFLAFSGQKLFAPPGAGVLYGRKELLEQMSPLCPGGGTVRDVTRDGHTFEDLPRRLEGGTPDSPAVTGLGAAVKFLEQTGIENVMAHERALLAFALERLAAVRGITLYGPAGVDGRAGIVALNVKGWHCDEVCRVLDKKAQIAVRGGMHCAQPMSSLLHPDGVVRVSLAPYNTRDEIETLTGVLNELS
jgi:cysteine desulfurase/selenocysteine lyase